MSNEKTVGMVAVSRVIRIAQQELDANIQEAAGNRNTGVRVNEYQKSVGLGDKGGYPWCAAFTYWCVEQGLGKSNPLSSHGAADCDVWLMRARKGRYLYDSPVAGDMFLVMASHSDAVHIGFVLGVRPDGTIRTIEGNSNDTGSREGYKVCSNIRRTTRLKFVRWASQVMTTPDDAAAGGVFAVSAAGIPMGSYPIIDGQVFVPVRELGEKLGFTVEWDKAMQLVALDRVPITTLLSRKDADGSIQVPIRAFARAAGYSISLKEREVILTNNRTAE